MELLYIKTQVTGLSEYDFHNFYNGLSCLSTNKSIDVLRYIFHFHAIFVNLGQELRKFCK